jgi:SAM-dependent methyltransferase
MGSEESNQGSTPWDTGKPQPVVIELERSGSIQGSVLDIGCSTGENALYLASKGYRVTGIDSSPTAIAKALLKASRMNLKVKFIIFDSLQLKYLGMEFDTIIDCGLFHHFKDETRPMLVQSLKQVLRPGGYYHLLCFSEGDYGGSRLKRVTKGEIYYYFSDGWEIESISKKKFETNYGKGWNWAWFASILKLP